jgi:hypothetical protein
LRLTRRYWDNNCYQWDGIYNFHVLSPHLYLYAIEERTFYASKTINFREFGKPWEFMRESSMIKIGLKWGEILAESLLPEAW